VIKTVIAAAVGVGTDVGMREGSGMDVMGGTAGVAAAVVAAGGVGIDGDMMHMLEKRVGLEAAAASVTVQQQMVMQQQQRFARGVGLHLAAAAAAVAVRGTAAAAGAAGKVMKGIGRAGMAAAGSKMQLVLQRMELLLVVVQQQKQGLQQQQQVEARMQRQLTS
jgi:hypothetical protein